MNIHTWRMRFAMHFIVIQGNKMASGIYIINFSGCAYYIGKSNDIERRWREHTTKFQKGTAAKAMQEAYDLYGMPEFRIHIECHEDHADLLESISIEHNRHLLINTTQPKIISEEDREVILANKDLIQLSTAEHLRIIGISETALNEERSKTKNAVARKEAECYRVNKEVVDGLQEELDRLTFQYSELEKAYDKIINRDQFIVDLLEELSAAEVLIKNIREDSLHQISSLNAEIEALRSRSLWQCICSK